MRRALLVSLLLLSACGGAPSAAPLDPVAMVDKWRDLANRQTSYRFEYEVAPDAAAGWSRTMRGTVHTQPHRAAELVDTTKDRALPEPAESHALRFDSATFLQRNGLGLPAGKQWAKLDYAALWAAQLDSELAMALADVDPAGAFGDLDRGTLRLVETGREDSTTRYVFAAGSAPVSGPASSGEIRSTAWVDANGLITKVEQVSRDRSGATTRKTSRYSDWGSAPAVEQPAADVVANSTECTWTSRR